tara:strand:+ start:31334 stop:32212 length:879 start_codon:yes stop_codon:yes gene_type:complete
MSNPGREIDFGSYNASVPFTVAPYNMGDERSLGLTVEDTSPGITSFSAAVPGVAFGGIVTVTDAGHGLSNGDMIIVAGAAGFDVSSVVDGEYEVQNLNTNTFDIGVSGFPGNGAGTLTYRDMTAWPAAGTLQYQKSNVRQGPYVDSGTGFALPLLTRMLIGGYSDNNQLYLRAQWTPTTTHLNQPCGAITPAADGSWDIDITDATHPFTTANMGGGVTVYSSTNFDNNYGAQGENLQIVGIAAGVSFIYKTWRDPGTTLGGLVSYGLGLSDTIGASVHIRGCQKDSSGFAGA